MDEHLQKSSLGERSISKSFIARYAAEAALRTEGVAGLEAGKIASIKESLGAPHEGKGVRVRFDENHPDLLIIEIYPIIYYGFVLPDVAFAIQENVKRDIEEYTDLYVSSVDVHVKDIIEASEDYDA
ncbi:MAG: Asp23/Gls24 family envelope stress response protein [Eubacteriales bacterium]|nr:Asp23/Gls24 family envelope stress response protein [Eubacteriales bacterium]